MRLNLYCAYWSLMFATLISSCFLFYIVAADNENYVTTNPVTDAPMASVDQYPILTTPSSTTNTPSVEPKAAIDAAAASDSKLSNKNTLYADKDNKFDPSNGKVKNLILDKQTTKLYNSVSDLPSPSIVIDVEISQKDNEIIKSSDSLNENSVEDKNLFNTIDNNGVNKNENSGLPAPMEMPNEKNIKLEEPDIELRSELRNTKQYAQRDNTDISNDLPDITDIPTVIVTELPLEALQQPQNTLDSIIIDDGGDRSKEEAVRRSIEVITETEEERQKDDQIVKINDSGGGGDGLDAIQPIVLTTSSSAVDQEESSITNSIPTDTNNISTTETAVNAGVEQEQDENEHNISSPTTSSQANLTATEEVPMPVFSEWAQKQMEAAEKQKALEQEQTVNNSAQRKNNTNGTGKPIALKLRSKNYASPDCGAKIIASSAYTSNAGAVLSSSKDEYMLSLCGNRIWFVVELCEAIQAQKIDFANFELYSSSPQNFTVAVSKRFPTRDWSNVGRFEAEDKRAVQSFNLHPHLFGKFVRVDINSHYSKEHFCTLSLFRVFGTSEFEAFETENHPNEDLDDFDDEYLLEQNTVKHAESNLFKSASDAVLSIVKKATEVLGKPANNLNQTFKTQPQSVVCHTPIYGLFNCVDCPTSLVEKVNNILTCEFSQLHSLLSNKNIRNDLINTRVCAKLYGIETKTVLKMQKDIKRSFYMNILPNEYVGALCQLLAKPTTFRQKSNDSLVRETNENETAELPTNLTIDKKFGKEDLKLLDHPEEKLMKPEITTVPVEQTRPSAKTTSELPETTTEINVDNNEQLPRPFELDEQLETTTLPPKIIQKPNLPDTNIFNVPADELSSETEVPITVTETPTSCENLEQTAATDTVPPPTTSTPTPPHINEPSKNEDDSNSWDNIEHLLTTAPSHMTTGNIASSAQYNQPKNSNGPQSESVFIRLSNRIKALERNMSLSGQYLEELSRRYKKQVEELQQTLIQQVQTVRSLEEENRRHQELEEFHILRNTQLKDELDNLTLQIHACIVVIIFVGAFVFLVLMVAILLYRSLRRESKEVLSLYDKVTGKKTNDLTVATTVTQQKINRRQSFEGFSNHQQSVKGQNRDAAKLDKSRRPSEEAMLILKDCKRDTAKLPQQYERENEEQEDQDITNDKNSSTARQRKLSVCYGNGNNVNQSNNNCSGLPPQHPQKSQNKRKGEKHSWPNTTHAQLQSCQDLVELNTGELIGDSTEIPIKVRKPPALNSKSKKKKEGQSLKRQQSSPAESFTNAELRSEFDKTIMLDEDDLDNFIPNTDLAYNEFMPDGPSGYQCINPNLNANNPASKNISNKQVDNNLKKSRRLSSPVFFKSPFTKSLKGKLSNSNKSNPAHESTSWEWYRLKKSPSSASSSGGGGGGAVCGDQIASSISNSTNNAFLRVSPNTSLDSSSLSEINFPTNSTENSFRILEEAILTSGENAISTTTTPPSNSKKSSVGLSSSSNSNRSSSSNSSTQSKKKNRSFNKIFRKLVT